MFVAFTCDTRSRDLSSIHHPTNVVRLSGLRTKRTAKPERLSTNTPSRVARRPTGKDEAIIRIPAATNPLPPTHTHHFDDGHRGKGRAGVFRRGLIRSHAVNGGPERFRKGLPDPFAVHREHDLQQPVLETAASEEHSDAAAKEPEEAEGDTGSIGYSRDGI